MRTGTALLVTLALLLGCPSGGDDDDDVACCDDDDATADDDDDDTADDDDDDATPGDDDDSAPGDDDDDDTVGPTEAGVFTAQLPSDAAPGDGLAIRVQYPASEDVRHAEGAPVLVRVPGGWDTGDLGADEPGPEMPNGYIIVHFLLPGGEQDGETSDGEYDYRGPNCITALRDVIRYAGGEIEDENGMSIEDSVPFAWMDNLGVEGGSNGGNLVIQTLAEEAAQLPDVAWLLFWESPIGDQYQTKELNDNPYYVPGTCTATTCPWPGIEAALAFDPVPPTDGHEYDGSEFEVAGKIFIDDNGNGQWDIGEVDLLWNPGPRVDPGQILLYPSSELSEAIDNAGVFDQLPAPAWLAPPSAVAGYWPMVDGSLRIAEAHANFPDLLVLHVGTQTDHAQDQPDYPHARSNVLGWITAGHAFVRLNPDAAYTALLTGEDPSNFPDNDANEPVAWPGTDLLMLPDSADQFAAPAAILELSDRYATANTDVNLTDVLVP